MLKCGAIISSANVLRRMGGNNTTLWCYFYGVFFLRGCRTSIYYYFLYPVAHRGKRVFFVFV